MVVVVGAADQLDHVPYDLPVPEVAEDVLVCLPVAVPVWVLVELDFVPL